MAEKTRVEGGMGTGLEDWEASKYKKIANISLILLCDFLILILDWVVIHQLEIKLKLLSLTQ